MQFWGSSGPLKSIVNHCCLVRSKQIDNGISTTAAADCIAPDWSVHVTLTFLREKSARHHCDAASCQNSLTTYYHHQFIIIIIIRLRVSPPRIEIAASNYPRWFIDVLGGECPILGNLAPQKPKIGRIGQPP